MNKKMRARVSKLIQSLQGSNPDLGVAQDILSDILDTEETSRDNVEEYFPDSDLYCTLSDNCDYLEEAIDSIDVDDPDCVEDVIKALQQIDGI